MSEIIAQPQNASEAVEGAAVVLTGVAEQFSAKKWILIFFVSSISGVAFSLALAGIIYGSRASYPENTLTFQKAVEKTILCGIYFGLTCGLLFVLAKQYGYNLELIIMSAILLAGILASIGTSIPWQSLVGIGLVLIGVPSMRGIRKIKKYYKDKANEEAIRQEQRTSTAIAV